MSSKDFPVFADAVHERLVELSKHELFVVNAEDVYTAYLLAFPAGTDPIFGTKTEHDCNCCKNFIRNFGRVVAIVNGQKQSVWGVDTSELPHPYNVVAAELDALVTNAPIVSVFRTKEVSFGSKRTVFSSYGDEKHKYHGIAFHHFYGNVARRHFSNKPAEARAILNTNAQVLERSLKELTLSSTNTVLDLIDNPDRSQQLYRGAEFRNLVIEFKKLQEAYRVTNDPEVVIWSNINSQATRFRNTVIGTLVDDLSNGIEINRAVNSFETKVAPYNYKRPTAIITESMIKQALKTLSELQLEDAIHRRFARAEDISVNDVLWVNNKTRDVMKGGLSDLLMSSASKKKSFDETRSQKLNLEDFLGNVLPSATSLEVLLKSRHLPNFVSLTAPQHENTGRLFKWRNDFAWSYDGNFADSLIKERVKRAGGNVNAKLRISLSWSNYDDLDLHCECPNGHIYFGNKMGILDVDMNAGGAQTREPVENMSWNIVKPGTYMFSVNQFAQRESTNVGFTLELEYDGIVTQYSSVNNPSNKITEGCFSFIIDKNGLLTNLKHNDKILTVGVKSTDKWGVKTETFVPVNIVTKSPNYWNGAGNIGNEHLFFFLKDCANPESTRGIYNEYLRGELEPHRRVFEVLGNKTMCEPTSNQLSGVGFSSTRSDEVVVRVKNDTSTREYNLIF